MQPGLSKAEMGGLRGRLRMEGVEIHQLEGIKKNAQKRRR